MLRFHAVYDKISKALDDLPYDEIGISDEVKEQVKTIEMANNRINNC